MIIQQAITEKLQTALVPAHLDVINESHMHNVPPGSESHFKVIVVLNNLRANRASNAINT
jgi:BolA protein